MDNLSHESTSTRINRLTPEAVSKSRGLLDKFLAKGPEASLSEYDLALRMQGISKAVSNIIEAVIIASPEHNPETADLTPPQKLRIKTIDTTDGSYKYLEATQETILEGASLELSGNRRATGPYRGSTIMRTSLPTRQKVENWLTIDESYGLAFEDDFAIRSSVIGDDGELLTSYPFHAILTTEEARDQYLQTTIDLISLLAAAHDSNTQQ